MVIPGFHDTVHQTTLIGKKEQPLGFLIKAANRIYPHRIIQIFRYCHLFSLLLGTADNPSRFVKKDKNLFLLYHYRFSVNTDLIFRRYFHSC